jgi:hypothetical protein
VGRQRMLDIKVRPGSTKRPPHAGRQMWCHRKRRQQPNCLSAHSGGGGTRGRVGNTGEAYRVAYLGVRVNTVTNYRKRGQMPEPDATVGRTHIWRPGRIVSGTVGGRGPEWAGVLGPSPSGLRQALARERSSSR